MRLAQTLEGFLMCFGAGKVFQILWVSLAVVQFLDRSCWAGEVPLGGGHFFLIRHPIEIMANLAAVGPGGGLIVAEVRHVVADI